MTELLLQIWLFWVAWWLYPKRTYAILLGAALLNPLIYQLEADSYWLLAVCATVNTGTAALIWRWGDVHKLYQGIILCLAVILTFLCELDMGGSNLVLSDYEALVRGLTLAQLLGAGYGLGTNKINRPPREHRA